MCRCIYACVHVYRCIYTCVHVYMCTCIHTYTCIFVANVHASGSFGNTPLHDAGLYMYIYICIYIYTYVYIYVYVYICIYMCIYIYKHIANVHARDNTPLHDAGTACPTRNDIFQSPKQSSKPYPVGLFS